MPDEFIESIVDSPRQQTPLQPFPEFIQSLPIDANNCLKNETTFVLIFLLLVFNYPTVHAHLLTATDEDIATLHSSELYAAMQSLERAMKWPPNFLKDKFQILGHQFLRLRTAQQDVISEALIKSSKTSMVFTNRCLHQQKLFYVVVLLTLRKFLKLYMSLERYLLQIPGPFEFWDWLHR